MILDVLIYSSIILYIKVAYYSLDVIIIEPSVFAINEKYRSSLYPHIPSHQSINNLVGKKVYILYRNNWIIPVYNTVFYAPHPQKKRWATLHLISQTRQCI